MAEMGIVVYSRATGVPSDLPACRVMWNESLLGFRQGVIHF